MSGGVEESPEGLPEGALDRYLKVLTAGMRPGEAGKAVEINRALLVLRAAGRTPAEAGEENDSVLAIKMPVSRAKTKHLQCSRSLYPGVSTMAWSKHSRKGRFVAGF